MDYDRARTDISVPFLPQNWEFPPSLRVGSGFLVWPVSCAYTCSCDYTGRGACAGALRSLRLGCLPPGGLCLHTQQ